MCCGKDVWRAGVQEQAGLCSPCTHDYCVSTSDGEDALSGSVPSDTFTS